MADEQTSAPSTGSSEGNEVEQDLETLNTEVDTDADTETDEESGEESGEDRAATRRAETSSEEDTEDEEEEEEALGDIEDEETDEEEETPIGDKEEDRAAYSRLPIKAVKEKYPNLFKEFPQLKAAFFQYPQYQEIFADVDSAKDAAAKAQEYDALEATLVTKADPTFLLQTLAENNPKALKRMVANLGPTLKAVDNDSYLQLTTPIIEELLYHAAAHGSKIGDKNLQLSARHLANFVFANGGEIPDISKHKKQEEPSEAEVQLQRERQQYASEKYDNAFTNVVQSIDPEINKILYNKLDGLSSFERKQIVKESRDEIGRILSADSGFQQTLRTLWRKAAESGYTTESKSRIRSAWLDRARLVAPSVRNRLKQEALGARNGSKRVASDSEGSTGRIKFKTTSEKRTFPERGGKTPSGQSSRVLDPKKIDWKKTSDRDILDMK